MNLSKFLTIFFSITLLFLNTTISLHATNTEKEQNYSNSNQGLLHKAKNRLSQGLTWAKRNKRKIAIGIGIGILVVLTGLTIAHLQRPSNKSAADLLVAMRMTTEYAISDQGQLVPKGERDSTNPQVITLSDGQKINVSNSFYKDINKVLVKDQKGNKIHTFPDSRDDVQEDFSVFLTTAENKGLNLKALIYAIDTRSADHDAAWCTKIVPQLMEKDLILTNQSLNRNITITYDTSLKRITASTKSEHTLKSTTADPQVPSSNLEMSREVILNIETLEFEEEKVVFSHIEKDDE